VIPTIEDIIAGMESGQYSREQAIGWLHKHALGPTAWNEDRRMFAAMAMQGFCTEGVGGNYERIAADSVKLADALLAELEKPLAQGKV